MPVYNCEATVAEAIASILNQTFKDWTLVIYDDGSIDSTVRIAQKFADPRIQVVQGGLNRHLAGCLNAIVASCKTEFFARMDGDDIAYPHRFEAQLSAIEGNPALDLLGGSSVIFDDSGRAHGLRCAAQSHADICGHPWSVSNLAHVTWFGRSAWFHKNPYDERTVCAQDRDLLTRTRRNSTFGAVSDVVMGIRESRPQWRKLLPSRKQMLITFVREGYRQRDPSLLLVTAFLEVAKFGLDFAATSTGLNYRLLKHRVPSVPPETARQWWEVFESTRVRVVQEIGTQATVLT
jgi:glycosyltransferase involved in cell wall biosynthesis